MVITNKMQDAINEQINAEMYSSYLYLQMSAWLEANNFRGSAAWMRKQSGEETRHAMKFYEYLLSRGGKVSLKAIAAPVAAWKKPLEIFEESYKHELEVTKLIYGLLKTAQSEDDPATTEMLQWFVKEQVEEEASTNLVVEQLKMAGDSKGALLAIDHHLGKRE
jgi:ferritin